MDQSGPGHSAAKLLSMNGFVVEYQRVSFMAVPLLTMMLRLHGKDSSRAILLRITDGLEDLTEIYRILEPYNTDLTMV